MLVEQHADEQRERVAAQQFVGGVVLGDAEGRHTHMVPQGRSGGTGTKLWVQDAGEDATKRAVEPSLGNLGLDHLDLYLIHQPFGDYYGAWRAMQDLNRQGVLAAIVVSNFSPDRLVDLIDHNEVTPAVNQIETHPFVQRAEYQQLMAERGVQIESWGRSPRAATTCSPSRR